MPSEKQSRSARKELSKLNENTRARLDRLEEALINETPIDSKQTHIWRRVVVRVVDRIEMHYRLGRAERFNILFVEREFWVRFEAYAPRQTSQYAFR